MRSAEFYFLLAGLGVTGVLWFLLPLLVLSRTAAPEMLGGVVGTRGSIVWLMLASLGASILLLFGPVGTIIHQMPFAVPLVAAAYPIAFLASVGAAGRRAGVRWQRRRCSSS